MATKKKKTIQTRANRVLARTNKAAKSPGASSQSRPNSDFDTRAALHNIAIGGAKHKSKAGKRATVQKGRALAKRLRGGKTKKRG